MDAPGIPRGEKTYLNITGKYGRIIGAYVRTIENTGIQLNKGQRDDLRRGLLMALGKFKKTPNGINPSTEDIKSLCTTVAARVLGPEIAQKIQEVISRQEETKKRIRIVLE